MLYLKSPMKGGKEIKETKKKNEIIRCEVRRHKSKTDFVK